MNYCTNCGHDLGEGDKFCAACGYALADDVTQQPQSQQETPAAVTPRTEGGAPTFDYQGLGKHSRIATRTPENGTYEYDAVVEFGDLHPNALWLFCVSYMSKTAILVPLFLIALLFMPWLAAAALALYVSGHCLAAWITYRNYSFEITPTAFKKRYGVIHKRSASIPFDRVQNVKSERNLIDRMLGLSHLEIETAGHSGKSQRNVLGGTSSSSEGYVPGVAADEAQDMKELIMMRAQRVQSTGRSSV